MGRDDDWAAVMGLALDQARAALATGDVPVGAVVLDPAGEVVGRGRNEREARADPTGHAEMVALREAARSRGEWRLDGCTLVVTLEPCTMCAGALVLARVQRLVFGAFDDKAGAVGSLWDVVRDRRLNHRPEVIAGVRADECSGLLRDFFEGHRAEPVVVVPYDPAWPARFEQVRDALTEALSGVPVHAIEHVGSTAVPGLAAKPVLDVDVVVEADDVPAAVAALQRAGYVHRGELGVPGRHAFTAPDEEPRRHVYVCVAGSLALRNHLAVREVLRADPALRDAYATVKLGLVEAGVGSVGEYVAGKNAVLQRVLARAGLSEAERAAILEVNRSG